MKKDISMYPNVGHVIEDMGYGKEAMMQGFWEDGRFVNVETLKGIIRKKEEQIAALRIEIAYLENKEEQWRGLCETCPEIAALQDRIAEAERLSGKQEEVINMCCRYLEALADKKARDRKELEEAWRHWQIRRR